MWPVQGEVWDQGWGWQNEEGYGMEDLPLEAQTTVAGPGLVGRK